MRLNRRNVLIGLGTIVAGGGAALGTGAFSSVEATRDINLGTTGDSGALLGLKVTNDTLKGADGPQLEIDVDNLNEDAETTFEDAILVTNNSENTITVEIQGELPNGITITNDEDDLENGITLGPDGEGDDSVSLDVDIDTGDDNWKDQGDETITFEANQLGSE
ncbi:hypothetical protein ACLI4Y_07310 [Natrialbaceae archaeon A-CW3]